MNERKNVKIKDEHGKSRDARVICGIDVDGTDYVLYSVERDEENDNLFVSKILKNNDATSRMVNIEDSMEKAKLVEVIKELMTYALNASAEKTEGVVKLNDGREVKITFVMFNEEQNINIGKTYVTTVKRAFTKVGSTFYNVEAPKTPVVESVFDASVETNDVFPEMNAPEETPVQEPVAPVMEQPAAPVAVEPILPEVPSEPTVVPPVLPETPVAVDAVTPPVVSEPTVAPVPEVAPPVIEQPAAPVAVEPILPEAPVNSAPVVAAPSVPTNEAAQIVIPKQEEVVVPPISVVEPTPTPVVAAESVASQTAPADEQIVLDASKETNLNTALGEVSKDNILPVPDVAPIKEFGQDEPPAMAAPKLDPVPVKQNTGPVLVRKAGFANNKFFMVVAITFFLAACVFLGYEVFQYFRIVG